MELVVTPSGASLGASVRGVDLTQPLSPDVVAAIRSAWLDHHVLAFPDQAMNDDDLERFTLYFGPFGVDPFIRPIPGRDHVIAVHRAADETASIFAENFHADWSFQEFPPQGTCLFGIEIPPEGGDTIFTNQHKALEDMPEDLRRRIEGCVAIHSAQTAYGPKGVYGEADDAEARAMDIIYSPEAQETFSRPLVRTHPETGRLGLYSAVGYICGIEGMDPGEARDLLVELYRWQTRPAFQYRHKWEPNMLVMWDNRCVLHAATGGYDGHERLLHRTTIGSTPETWGPE